MNLGFAATWYRSLQQLSRLGPEQQVTAADWVQPVRIPDFGRFVGRLTARYSNLDVIFQKPTV